MKPILKTNQKLSPKQSDITIDLDGTTNVSFLWDDLIELSDSEIVKKTQERPDLGAIKHNLSSSVEDYINCQLCPLKCGANREANPHKRCGDDKLRLSNFGISFGDEELIRGKGGSGVIMLSGCPMTCPSCHNPEKVHSLGRIISEQDFINLAIDHYTNGADNIQIISPTVHFPRLRSTLQTLKESNFPLPVVLKTSGYDSIEELQKLEGLVDIFLPDLKFGPCELGATLAKAPKYFDVFIENIKTMLAIAGKPQVVEGTLKRGVLVRHIKSPYNFRSSKEINSFFEEYKTQVMVSILDSFVELTG